MEYLIKVVNTYRVGTVAEALELRKKLQNTCNGNLIGFSYVTKYIKEKGEIVEEYQVCKATIEYNSEKDPDRRVQAVYEED